MGTDKHIEIPVVRLQEGELVLYQGKLKARELLDTWDVKRFKEEYLVPKKKGPGSEREEDKYRTKQIQRYVQDCQIPLVPSILLAVKDPDFKPGSGDRNCGILKIPRSEGAVNVIDGQHRGFGFALIRDSINEKLRETGKEDVEILQLKKLLDFELPTTFVDSSRAAKVANEKIDKSRMEGMPFSPLSPDDVERVFFFVINKTQKSINASLKDALMFLIDSGGIRGIPIITKEFWRTEAVPLVRDLQYERDSPLYGLINLIGRRGSQEPVKLNNFVSSLKPLILKNEQFKDKLTYDEQLKYLKEYWLVLKELYPRAFFTKDIINEYLILKSLSVQALNRLANDVFNWCLADGVKVPTQKEIRKYLAPLKDFDWSRQTSPIVGLGGSKGVDRAHRLLLEVLSKSGIKEAKVSLDRLEQRLWR